MRFLTVSFLFFALALLSVAQVAGACPGGRVISGFQLTVEAPAGGPALPLTEVNDLQSGDTLYYVPYRLPVRWRNSAHVAMLIVPQAEDGDGEFRVFTQPAKRAGAWTLAQTPAAVAFLFGPRGFNANKTRSLLAAHPELVARFTDYAAQAARVEALVRLLAAYEQSPPGSVDLNAELKQYSAVYGVDLPSVNPALSPAQEAAALLAAVAPPTAENGPSPHAALAAGSTSTAAALASLYFGPEMGIANTTLPLFRALHNSLFPGTEFQGAFADPAAGGTLLCSAATAASRKHPVFIWMDTIPGGAPPAVRLAQGEPATLPARWKSKVPVTCASVGQLRALPRARDWELVGPTRAAVPVRVAVGELDDTLTLDLRQATLAPGDYHLTARWDWTPITVSGTFRVAAIPDLAAARIAPAAAGVLVTKGGPVAVPLTGADFSFVNKAELAPQRGGGAPQAVPFKRAAGRFTVALDTDALAPGKYNLRLIQINGAAGSVPLVIHAPNPSLEDLPLRVNAGAASAPVILRGRYLERLGRITSPNATWTLAPVAAQAHDLTERAATVSLNAKARAGDDLAASLFVEGLPTPILVPDALRVLGPRPAITSLERSLETDATVAPRPEELPSDATANFTFVLAHGPTDPAIRLRCAQAGTGGPPITLRVGQPAGAGELDAGGDGLFYLSIAPGRIAAPGCELQMIALDPASGDSAPYDLGRIVELPRIARFTLTNRSVGPNLYAGELTGQDLQLIAKTGWSAAAGVAVTSIPLRHGGTSPVETLEIAMPWPPPAPHAPLYIWLRGERQGRKTTVAP